jgi:NAD-dependent deacetylase
VSEEVYARAIALLRKSRRAVALTGAGISTPSGIPDFRSPGTGLWSQVDPMQVASIQAFRRDPAAFYRWYGASARQMFAAQPNPAHQALAELERRGTLQAVVTQNIDRLHQKAGSRRVLELHGNCQTAHCLRCGAGSEAYPLLERFLETGEVPHCSCGGLIKPDVVLFGEMLPPDVLEEARQEIARCDLLLVVGSSLVVMPAAELPWLAVQARAPLILCNREATWADPYAAVILRDDVARSLPALLEGW